MRKRFASLALSAVGIIAALSLPAAQAAAAPYCGITWGSLTKSSLTLSGKQLTNIRTGQHECYDRMVFDLTGTAKGYHAQYVTNVYSDGEGALIPVNGGAKLQIMIGAASYDVHGNPTYSATVGAPLPGLNIAGYKTFRDAKFAGSFEGQTTVGLGVRAKLPFRVFTVDNKVVVDVAHYW
jgi:hypothetical protein